MSRWSKRSQEEKERILQQQQHQERVSQTKIDFQILSLDYVKEKCDKAKKAAGHEGESCSVCNFRCPGCPFEFAWPKEGK
jgi:hypothetical protein